MGGKYYLSPCLSCGLVNLEETIWVTAELYSDNPKQWQFAYFFFVWYCFLLSRGLVSRAEIYTHKAATLLLITHINLFFFFYWSIGVVLHVNVEATLSTRLCSDLNKDTKYFRPTYFVKKPAFVYAEKPDSVKLLSSCFESTKCTSIGVKFSLIYTSS